MPSKHRRVRFDSVYPLQFKGRSRLSKITKEQIYQVITEFVYVHGRYPTKAECAEVESLHPYSTILRVAGKFSDMKILEEYYKTNPKLCKNCSDVIPFDKRKSHIFCDHSCSASYNNTGKKQPRRIKNCFNCNKQLRRSDSKYCNTVCQHEFQFKHKISEWKKGKNFNNPVLRKMLIYLYENKCSVCGISNWMGKTIVLEVDHIDGNSSDSSIENVRLICPNCHSQTDTYKGKNAGNGRHYRRIRYSEGKSF